MVNNSIKHKTKLRLLIRAYLLFNDKATAEELSNWLNNEFQWNKEVTPGSIGGLLSGFQCGGVLYDLAKTKRPSCEGGVYEYYLKK